MYPALAAEKVRILFVKDDVGKRYVIARQLRGAGYIVDEASTGEQGLAMVSPDHDVVVLDLHLPDIDGWEVCRAQTPTWSIRWSSSNWRP